MTISQEAREAAAKALGYRDWADATDYRLSGEQDRQRDRMAYAFAAFEQRILTQAEARTAAAAPTDAGALVDELEEAIHRWSPERFTEIRARHMGDSTLITPRFTADTLAIVEDAAPTFEAFADLVVLAVNSLPRILTALRASTGTPAEGEGEKR